MSEKLGQLDTKYGITAEIKKSDILDKIKKNIYPLLLSGVFLSIYFIVDIPSHWEKGFHVFYFILMTSFLGYICFVLNEDQKEKKNDHDHDNGIVKYMDTLVLFSILFFGIYFLFTTFMNMSGNNQNTFLKSMLLVVIGIVMFLLFQFRVPNDVSKIKYNGNIEEALKTAKEAVKTADEQLTKAKEEITKANKAVVDAQEEVNNAPDDKKKKTKEALQKKKEKAKEAKEAMEALQNKKREANKALVRMESKGKSYFISIITEPFYIVKDAF